MEPIAFAIDGRLARIEGICLLMQNAFSETEQNADAAVYYTLHDDNIGSVWSRQKGCDGSKLGPQVGSSLLVYMQYSYLGENKDICLPG